MKRLPAALLFLSAAVYLIVQGNLDVITVMATISCALCGAIALSPNSIWAVIGGIGLISISLGMQTVFETSCLTCLKADVLILTAVICLSLMQKGKVKTPSQVMAGIMTVILLAVTMFVAPITTGDASNNSASTKVSIEVDNQIKELAKTKPVLLFSPKCPACSVITTELIKIDPKGEKWQPVQTGGQEGEGARYLGDKGFQGKPIYHKFAGAVPTLVVVKDGKVELLRGEKAIMNAVK